MKVDVVGPKQKQVTFASSWLWLRIQDQQGTVYSFEPEYSMEDLTRTEHKQEKVNGEEHQAFGKPANYDQLQLTKRELA